MEQYDNENYWNSSSCAFSFDDDDDLSASSGNKFDSEKFDSILNDDNISEASFDNSAVGSALNLSIKSIISEEALKIVLQEQSMDDRIMPKGVTPEEELRLLRRQVQTTLYNPSPQMTAQKLLLGKSVSLEVFKSLHEKHQLLDEVYRRGGGDALIGVLLFLKKTLNPVQFHKTLQDRPWAIRPYISYMQQCLHPEAVDLLRQFGRHQETALLQFKTALATGKTIQDRKQKLVQLLEQYAKSGCVVSVFQQAFHDAFKLLELIEKEGAALDNTVHLDSTPVEVLYACCRKHPNWKEPADLVKVTSPHRVCAEQQISAAQFEWTALNERARAHSYGDLESVFERVPTWHPMKQKQFHISFSLEQAVQRLHELEAPPSVLYLFLAKMGNAGEKLELARRVKCVKAEIDALAGLKDTSQLLQLRESVPERSEEQFYCDNAVKGLQSKRWTTDNIKLKL